MPDSSAKTRVDSGNSTPDSSRNAQLQLLRAAAEAEYAFQSDDDEPGLYLEDRDLRFERRVI